MDVYHFRFPEPPQLDWNMLVQYSSGADTSFMTYFSFYFLSTVCLCLTALVGLKQSMVEESKSNTRFVSVLSTGGFFAAMVVHTFSLGWLHEYYQNWDNTEPPEFQSIWNAACLALVLAATSIFFIAETLRRSKGFGAKDETSGTVQSVLYIMVGLITLVLVVITLGNRDPTKADDKEVMAYIFLCCVMAYLFIISLLDIFTNDASDASRHLATATALYGLGLIFQVALMKLCSGPQAAQTKGCPLPDSFNHNALFNIFQILAVTILGLGVIRMVDEDVPADEEPTKEV